MNSYLSVFTIGPVQSFIQNARKTQDLFVGSQLLSDTISFTAREIETRFGVEETKFIFPPGESINETTDSKTNRIVVRIEAASDQTVLTVLEEVERSVRANFLTHATEEFIATVGRGSQAKGDSYEAVFSAFQQQISDLLEIYYTAIPFEGGDDNQSYRTAFRTAERSIGSIKNIRFFQQLSVPAGRKGSISGIRNALFYHAERPNRYLTNGLLVNPRIGGGYILSKGEAIDAVGFLKRTYMGGKVTFPSTADFALWNTSVHHEEAFETYRKNISTLLEIDLDHNGQLYFEDNLRGDYIAKQYPKNVYRNWRVHEADVRTAHATFRRDLGEDRLHKYYALLLFDGDRMGKWLSGELFSDTVDLADFHQRFSAYLSTYARLAKNYLNEAGSGRGRTVYAGGDDFMAFVSLEHLFETMEWLYQAFLETVSRPAGALVETEQLFTISMGVTIVHYKHPLDSALNEVRRMEKRAKNAGRNRFALSIIRNSGNITEFELPWQNAEGLFFPTILQELLATLTDRFGSEEADGVFTGQRKLSGNFIRVLRSELQRLDLSTGIGYLERVVLAESTRLVHRSKHKALNNTEVQPVIDHMENLFRDIQMIDADQSIDRLLSLLIVLDFLQRNTNQYFLNAQTISE